MKTDLRREKNNTLTATDCVDVVCRDGLVSVCKILLALYIPFLERLGRIHILALIILNFNSIIILYQELTAKKKRQMKSK